MKLERLKILIDEDNYPYFDDLEMLERIEMFGEDASLYEIARELCIVKAGIEEIKLGDITIPSPRRHFLQLAQRYRANMTGVVTRADEQIL